MGSVFESCRQSCRIALIAFDLDHEAELLDTMVFKTIHVVHVVRHELLFDDAFKLVPAEFVDLRLTQFPRLLRE